MNIFLRWFYYFLRINVNILFRIYFKEVLIKGKKYFKSEGPLILVSNHPNTMIDVFGAAMNVKPINKFLGNTGLFSTPFTNWFFSTFYTIPVQRPNDKGPKINNLDSFVKAYEYLEEKGCIYVAAEGGSRFDRVKHNFKTGAARIGLGAEKRNNFSLDVKILPVGITYDKRNYFRSNIRIEATEPIFLKDYKDKYEKNNQATIKEITSELKSRLYDKAIYFENNKQDNLFARIEEMKMNDNPVNFDEAYHRSKRLQEKYCKIWESNNVEFNNFINDLDIYFEELETEDFKDINVIDSTKSIFTKVLFLIFLFPLFFVGYILNLLPSIFTIGLLNKIKLDVGYSSTAKMILGWITFPIFYLFQYFILEKYLEGWAPLLITMLSLPLGLIAWEYKKMFIRIKKSISFKNYPKKSSFYEKRAILIEYITDRLE